MKRPVLCNKSDNRDYGEFSCDNCDHRDVHEYERIACVPDSCHHGISTCVDVSDLDKALGLCK